MALRITQLPELTVVHDSDLFVIVNTETGVTQKARALTVRNQFTASNQNSAVGTTSPIFQLALPDSTGLSTAGGVRLVTGSNSLVLRNGPDSDYSDIVALDGIFTNRVGIGLLSINPPLNFTLQVGGDIGPDVDSVFNLGSPSYQWSNVYSDTGSFTNIIASTASIGLFSVANFLLQPGSQTSPSLTFTDNQQSGLYETSSVPPGVVAITVNAQDAAKFSSGLTQIMGSLNVGNATNINGALSVVGLSYLGNDTHVTGSVTVTGQLTANAKSFLIDHPTKPGMKLQYGSLEGPEHDVFIRGKLVDTSIIFLPEYWQKLVDPDTITVQLTPFGKHQKLYVYSVTNKEIIIKNASTWDNFVNCYYTVFAERIDIPKLKTEF